MLGESDACLLDLCPYHFSFNKIMLQAPNKVVYQNCQHLPLFNRKERHLVNLIHDVPLLCSNETYFPPERLPWIQGYYLIAQLVAFESPLAAL